MDANGTRFHLLLGQDDWGRCTDARGRRLADLWRTGPEPPLAWDGERAELTLRPELFQFPAARRDRPPRPTDRRGAGRDRHGSWYWVEETSRAIVVLSVGSGRTSRFWPSDPDRPAPGGGDPGGFAASQPPPPPAPARLSGLAVTEDHYLVAGVLRPAGLLVFDLQAGGPPTQLLWPPTIPFHPADIAARPGGGAFVLDAAHRRAWALDRHLQVEPLGAGDGPDPAPAPLFRPADGSPTLPVTTATREVTLAHALALAGTPVAVEVAPNGGLLVLQRDPGAPASTIRLHRPGRPPVEAVAADEPLRVRVVGHDMALSPADAGQQGELGTLFVAERAGNQAYAFRLRAQDDALEAVLERAYYPMRRFGGKALVGAGGRVWYDFPDGWAPLVRQPQSRYVRSASLLTPVLDGREPSCVWHRLVLDACLPPGTAVAISSVAADEPEHLAGSTWRREPTPVARPRGPELPFATAGAGIWTSYELLLQQARGRYLQLRLELTGNQSTSPRLRALRVHYPRFSYLERYLPGVYREDADSANFLDRFLANLEGVSTEIEDQVAAAQVLFDPAAAPAEALDWLAGWFGVALDRRWDEPTRRLFIANAMRFFRLRGTVRGVELALRLALGPADQRTFADPADDGVDLRTVRVVETFKTRRAPGVVFGDPTDLAGPRLAAREPRWRPAQGGAELSRRYRERLALAGIQVPAGTSCPVGDPGGAEAPVWRAFADEVLGFVPDVGPTTARLWPAFLAHRYPTVGALNLAHGSTLQRFQDATPPARLPADGPALADWFTLQSVVLPTHRKAHRFTVLLPVRTRAGALAPVELRELARRVVALQKPAQTLFEVRFFWSAFRVGEARLGRSTVIESGSRAPELFAPAVLGREYLGEAHLGRPSILAYQEAP